MDGTATVDRPFSLRPEEVGPFEELAIYVRQISPGQTLFKSTGLNVSLSIQTGRSSLV
jgi:hypothetical protein